MVGYRCPIIPMPWLSLLLQAMKLFTKIRIIQSAAGLCRPSKKPKQKNRWLKASKNQYLIPLTTPKNYYKFANTINSQSPRSFEPMNWLTWVKMSCWVDLMTFGKSCKTVSMMVAAMMVFCQGAYKYSAVLRRFISSYPLPIAEKRLMMPLPWWIGSICMPWQLMKKTPVADVWWLLPPMVRQAWYLRLCIIIEIFVQVIRCKVCMIFC